MPREVKYNSIGEFVAAMKQLGVEKIAFCETNEKRAVQESPEVLAVQRVTRMELLAYRDAVLHKCDLSGIDLEEQFARLSGDGFQVTRTSRNIT